jgi:hypothetical protein
VHVHPEDLELAGHPLVAFQQSGVPRIVGDLLGDPVSHGVRAGAEHAHVALLRGGRHLRDGFGQVGTRLRDRLADAGDHLDARLEQFVLGLGMHTVAAFGDVGQDLVRAADQLAGVQVDELELPLDTQAGPL